MDFLKNRSELIFLMKSTVKPKGVLTMPLADTPTHSRIKIQLLIYSYIHQVL